jgi:hypothetical protein
MVTIAPAATTASPTIQAAGPARTFATLAAGFVVAGIATSIIAAVVSGLGAGFMPLTPALYLPFVLVGLLGAYLGWRIIRASVSRPFAVLRVLVPVVLVLSFVPDVALLIIGFIPGATPLGGIALMTMHLAVAAVAVPVAQKLLPVGRTTDARS